MAKMRKVTLYVLDLNNPMSEEDIASELEHMRYLESVYVGKIETADIGEWHDDHELNLPGANHEKYFK